MSALIVDHPKARKRKPAAKPLDLTGASEQDIVAAFMDDSFVKNPPRLPANMPGAIDASRRLIGGIVSVVEACRAGSDLAITPIRILPAAPWLDLADALTVAHRMLQVVAANHKIMAQLFPTKARENDPA
jgi:hypothetical protein